MSRYSTFATLCLLLAGCLSRHEDTALRFAVTDVEGLEQLQVEFGAFRDLLVEKSGLNIDFYPVSSRTAAVESLAHGKVDLVLTGPAEYVIFQSRTPVKPVIGLVRDEYYAVIATLAEDVSQVLGDLRGRKIAMGDVGSTSKHLAPVSMLASAGLKQDRDFQIVHVPIRTGWEMLQRGQVGAFATTSDKYFLLLESVPDKPVRVLEKSEPLPNDVLLARADLSDDLVALVRNAIAQSNDEFVAAILQGKDNQKYRRMAFDANITDSDYRIVRAMFRNAGLDQFSGD